MVGVLQPFTIWGSPPPTVWGPSIPLPPPLQFPAPTAPPPPPPHSPFLPILALFPPKTGPYFGRQVLGGPTEGLHGGPIADALFAEPKVGDLNVPVLIQHQILQLQNTAAMGGGLWGRGDVKVPNVGGDGMGLEWGGGRWSGGPHSGRGGMGGGNLGGGGMEWRSPWRGGRGRWSGGPCWGGEGWDGGPQVGGGGGKGEVLMGWMGWGSPWGWGKDGVVVPAGEGRGGMGWGSPLGGGERGWRYP